MLMAFFEIFFESFDSDFATGEGSDDMIVDSWSGYWDQIGFGGFFVDK